MFFYSVLCPCYLLKLQPSKIDRREDPSKSPTQASDSYKRLRKGTTGTRGGVLRGCGMTEKGARMCISADVGRAYVR